ncbi:MAG: metallophosphoesterase family protein [Clostridia bacterium]|nr:metallophosphoesterase family protein [Clostridia bacterium]
MKHLKKLLAVFAAALMLLSVLPAAAAETADTTLRFNGDGTFKIMLFADPQDDEDLEETTTALMCEALDKYQPDLVVYLGDNTVANGYDNQYKAIEAVTKPVVDRGIPYALVFGNHDEEHNVTKEELLAIYQSFGTCLTYDAVPALTGCGNCNIPIYSSDGAKIAFNLWMIDSNMYNADPEVGGYDYVHQDQLDWYLETAAALKAENGGEPVPAMDFQHIVIPEIFDELYVELPVSLGKLSENRNGKYYSLLPVFTRLNGYWLEVPCPPNVYDGQLAAWKEAGDVIAEFHGHDHNNSYQVNIEGVDVVNVPSCGCNSYSKDITRGCGLITLHENDPANYDYELVRMFDLALAEDSAIPNAQGGKAKAYYALVKALDTVVQAMFKVFGLFYKVFPDGLL